MLYLYAVIVRRPGLSIAIPGIGGAVVEIVPLRKIAVVLSPLDGGNVVATEANLWSHERVIEKAMEETTAIPLRFGTMADEWARVRRQLSERYRSLTARLAHLAGKVEFAVRLPSDAAEEPPVHSEASETCRGPGTAYLRSLAQTHDGWSRPIGAALKRSLESWAVASALWPQHPSAAELRASFLVERSKVDSFLDAAAAFRAGNPAPGLSCTGPWPPYSFANEPLFALPEGKRHP